MVSANEIIKTKIDEIDNKILEGLAKGKTQTEIASELKVWQPSISLKIRKMRERGIEIPIAPKTKKTKIDETDNKILEGLAEGKTTIEIANGLKLDQSTIYVRIRKMRKIGIEIPIVPKAKRTKNDETDNKILEGLAEGKTQAEIAQELNVTKVCISQRVKRMKERGTEIPIVLKAKGTKNDETDNKILKGLAEGKTQAEIAKELNVTSPCISQRVKRMRERGTEIPTISNHKKTKNDEIDNKILKGLAEGKTIIEIANELRLDQSTIYVRIRKMRKKEIEIPIILNRKKAKSAETDNKILEGLADGKTQTEIASELKVWQPSISLRIRKMRERGIEIPVVSNYKKVKSAETNNKILEGLAEGKTQAEIAKELNVTSPCISQRVKRMRERGTEIPTISNHKKTKNEQLAKEIIKLIHTKHATLEQVKIMGDYYGVDVESALETLEERER